MKKRPGPRGSRDEEFLVPSLVPRVRAFKLAVLTVNSDGTLVETDPNINENQSWILVKNNDE